LGPQACRKGRCFFKSASSVPHGSEKDAAALEKASAAMPLTLADSPITFVTLVWARSRIVLVTSGLECPHQQCHSAREPVAVGCGDSCILVRVDLRPAILPDIWIPALPARMCVPPGVLVAHARRVERTSAAGSAGVLLLAALSGSSSAGRSEARPFDGIWLFACAALAVLQQCADSPRPSPDNGFRVALTRRRVPTILLLLARYVACRMRRRLSHNPLVPPPLRVACNRPGRLSVGGSGCGAPAIGELDARSSATPRFGPISFTFPVVFPWRASLRRYFR